MLNSFGLLMQHVVMKSPGIDLSFNEHRLIQLFSSILPPIGFKSKC